MGSNSEAELSRFSAVNIVMGNESCDLDSTISALVYAYLLYSEMSVDAKETVTVIPLLKILKKEFPLKTEVTYYLKKNGIPMDLLVFWDSINLKELQMTSRLKLTLVDHHVLSPEAEFLCSSVVEVIDHHPQDPAWLWPMQKVTLTTVGSCCTLVASEVVQRCPGLISSQVAMLLYGPIILDTACFSQTAGRTTELDLKMAMELENRGVDSTRREKLFQELLAARSDVSNLTPSQLLEKDMKITLGIPVPGLPMLVQEFVAYPDVTEALKKFCAERETNVTVLMGLLIDGDQIQRDIAVFSSAEPRIAQEVIKCLMNSTDPALQLESFEVASENHIPGLQLFRQLNAKASRKQVLPIVRCAAECIVKRCQK
ncbi:exopolyphosphatase PRUNE1 isoform X2 [Cryptotermes secundus]|uniref:exopolyphosphatase PRUNE1 isoform X2 n=1 Tax=Cryptotermes secundus TaxID=105785 RepID=UPI000CD7AD49|nr:exopolyphosphatase PRUNE1 isoform X2 [Cryptotermes secundus]XP_033607576.1 exopolyphosphatase PRUNE1 isoform X2 [Cryptotermes secundus]